MRISKNINSIYNSVSYILADDKEKECILIDVGDFDKIRGLIKDYSLKAVFLTHVHYDHIYGLNNLYKIYNDIPIYTNRYGFDLLTNPYQNLSFYHGSSFAFLGMDSVVSVKNESNISVGHNFNVVPIYTPGHNPSCVTWDAGKHVFTGDSYIPGVRTVTKLPGGNNEDAVRSEILIKRLIEEKVVCPGHVVNNPSD